MADVLVGQNEYAKCGQLKSNNFSYSNSPDGRRLVFTTKCDFYLLDLFHMTQKKFSVLPDSLPTNLRSFSFGLVHWFHEDKALVVIRVYNERPNFYGFYSALIDIDHERSHFVFRDLRLLNGEQGERFGDRICKLFLLPDGFGIVLTYVGGLRVPTVLHVFLNSPDGEPKWTKRTLLPDNFCPMGVLDEFIHGFSFLENNLDYISPKKLVKICMETDEQTTLDVVTPVWNVVSWNLPSWIWIGRKLVINLSVQPPACDHLNKQLFILDVDSLQFNQLGSRFNNSVEHLTYDGENTLIVTTKGWWRNELTLQIYRFAINRPDTLGNSSWMAIRNKAKKSPGFDRHVLSLLPKNSPFHCALGSTRPSNERPF